MSANCCNHEPKFDGATKAFKRALYAVIGINAGMFAVEIGAGVAAGSQALLADALDFLGDTATYGLSLAVLGMSLHARAMAALLKGWSLAAMGIFVLGATAWRALVAGLPAAEVMGTVGLMALIANLLSVVLLLRFRDGDSNVRSVWLCSRNDAIGNVAVMAAAAGVWSTTSAWPDLIVAAAMAGLFLWSAFSIVRQATTERRQVTPSTVP